MQNEKLISEEYLIKEWEEEAAKKLKPIMSDLGAWRAMEGEVSARWWSSDSHLFVVSDNKQGRRRNEVKFFDLTYMDGSGIVYGKPTTSSEGSEEIEGTSKLFDNSGSTQPSKETLSREIKVASTVSHSVSQSHQVSIKSTNKISGEYSGVKFETAIEMAYGLKLDRSRTESENREVKETFTHQFEGPAGVIIQASIEKEDLVTLTPYTLNTYFDAGMCLNFEDWASERENQGNLLFHNWKKGDKKFTFNTLLEFEQFLNGYDVNYPQMKGYKPSPQSMRSMEWIFNKDNRKLEISGVRRREYNDNLRIRTVTL